MRIFLLENDKYLDENLQEYLEEMGCELVFAYDDLVGLRFAITEWWGVIIATEDDVKLSYGLLGWNRFSFGPLASFIIGEGFEEDDSDDLISMDEPDMTALHDGLFCVYETPYVDVELKFLNEILDEHSGQQVEISFEREWQFGDVDLNVEVFFGIMYTL
jgi:hypothetical protein